MRRLTSRSPTRVRARLFTFRVGLTDFADVKVVLYVFPRDTRVRLHQHNAQSRFGEFMAGVWEAGYRFVRLFFGVFLLLSVAIGFLAVAAMYMRHVR